MADESLVIPTNKTSPTNTTSMKLAGVLKGWDDRTMRCAGCVIFTDGNTRALAACLCGLTEVRALWDEDDMDGEEYRICL
jgi:hypothetical protein